MIKEEYLRFLQSLINNDISSDVVKIANLVLQNIDILVPLSTSQGQRIKKTVELAQTNWNSTSSKIQPLGKLEEEHFCPITQIKSLMVGPFRGFTKQEFFDLESKLVLIYGPNGTGKTSLCEALEYGLLGSVTDAESKRFHNLSDYLKNAYANSFTPSTLIGMDERGAEIPIAANEAYYRFCFIEKNRIDNFSRIAAQVPAKQTELIATLFGLDAFSEFVRNFTESMDKYIDIEGEKEKELNKKKQELAGCRQQLVSVSETLKEIEVAENNLSNEYQPNYTFSQMVQELNGSEEKAGIISKLETELQTPINTKSNLMLSTLKDSQQAIEEKVRELKDNQQKLTNASQQIPYKQLYEAVVQVRESSKEQCPVCHTPLSQVAINPYILADTELKKLQYLSLLQENIKKLNENISNLLAKLSQTIDICSSYFSKNEVLSACKLVDGQVATVCWWDSLHQQLADGLTLLQHIEASVKKMEEADKSVDQAVAERAEKRAELTRLRSFAEKIVILQTRRKAANETLNKAGEKIKQFDADNALLLSEVEKEKETVSQNQIIAKAYAVFVQKLNDYKNSLPAQLVADLGETIVQLYNAFNRHDTEYEQLAIVRLPLKPNERLEISFRRNPNSFFDVLHIFSEGHIRCMGLAILAAKNIKENCPFLIFDDPVNAIDDDHRESIRKTLFEDSFFDNKQIILACHGEEFFKDIQNMFPAEKARKIKAVTFLPKVTGSNICIDRHCSPRNYVVSARTHFDKGEIRDALDVSRKALECLTKNKIWHYVTTYGDGYLSIKLRSATAPIELRNLTEQLHTKIAKADFRDTNKNLVLSPIECLLGVSGDSREWRYLNKGTHEEADRAEFDRQTVCKIITALEQLDAAIS